MTINQSSRSGQNVKTDFSLLNFHTSNTNIHCLAEIKPKNVKIKIYQISPKYKYIQYVFDFELNKALCSNDETMVLIVTLRIVIWFTTTQITLVISLFIALTSNGNRLKSIRSCAGANGGPPGPD